MPDIGFANTGDSDVHVNGALQRGWNNGYKLSSANFKKQFVGVDDAILDIWFAKLTAKPIKFTLGNQRGVGDYPEVATWIDGDNVEEYTLGTDYEYNGQYGTVTFESTTITLELRAQNPELLRALRRAIKAIMSAARYYFVKYEHYQDIMYTGGQYIGPDEAQIAEQAGPSGVWVWRMYYRVKAHVFTPNPEDPEVSMTWFAQAKDVVGPNGAGGVQSVP